MSRLPAIDPDDSRDLADIDPVRPTRSELAEVDEFEPADFDDRRLADRFGAAGGFFAFETDYDPTEVF
jgi:hypothetical protein